ncbi:hypothetical protein N0Y54_35625 [Nostoc punctiforme UO1]|uniref:hypothetical protein n=1 Tax=Nostoc punctiforme TaxID=272131 RepID=UPI0030AE4D40
MQQSIITSLIVVIGAIALKIMALLNQNMNHAIAFCTANMNHTTLLLTLSGILLLM